MLSYGRDGVHARLHAVHRDRWQEGAQGSNRRLYVTPAVTGLQLGVLPKLVRRAQARSRDLGALEARLNLLSGQTREGLLNRGVQRLPVGDPPDVGAKALIVRKGRGLEDTFTEGAPFPLVLYAEEHRFLVLRHERTVGSDTGMAGARTWRRRPAVGGEIGGLRHPLAERLEEGDLGTRAESRAPAPIERQPGATKGIHTR